MRTDEIDSIINSVDKCKDLKALKAVIKIQAGLLKNRDRTVKKLKEELDRAVKDEREEIIGMIEKYLFDDEYNTYRDLFKAIRER